MSETAVSLSQCIKHKAMSEVRMARYGCHKEVHALPLTRGAYNNARDWVVPENENPADEGYLVVYNLGTADEYVSWSPKHIFDDGYHPLDNCGVSGHTPLKTENLTFGEALELVEQDKGNTSDGYHTFNELYVHRHALFINVVNANQDKSFNTLRNDSGEQWDGWFIAGINTVHGQITYHLPIAYWDQVKAIEVDCNSDYDGHSSADVVERLLALAAE